uniref:Uncharacterized protein n=1 Tax=Pithovirus LCPAC403 TaxID=2506596 RepID=A0A481ZE44_9VIRU|nr:MAG: uncharacterized protein LCPAC403_04230 [Pithovirus LCPAC403]
MTSIVCSKNNKHLPVFCKYDVELIIFLDKRNSSLIVRERKDSEWYKLHEHSIPKEIKQYEDYNNPEYYEFTIYGCDCYAYNRCRDYFVKLDIDTKDELKLRTHPDFISYVDEIYQIDLEVVNVPDGKKLTMISVGNNLLVVMSDGDCELV